MISLGGPAQIAKAKAELARLKEMNTVYLTQIDSLNTANTKLQAENKTLNSNLSEATSKNTELSSENSKLANKVAAGSILKAYNIVLEGLRYKSNNKAVVTDKAKQIQKIHSTFKLSENRVLDKGPTDIYLRMLGPDGSVMTPQGDFKAGNESLQYTTMQTVDYTGEETPMDVVLLKGGSFAKGKYNVEIYHSGQKIGGSTMDVK